MEDQVKAEVVDPRGHRKERVGVVVSNKSQKTITVAVETVKTHRLYKKALKRTKTFRAHDEGQECNPGDVVRIRETRPLSATKRWRLVEIIKRAD